jgi:acetylornithine deacetylase
MNPHAVDKFDAEMRVCLRSLLRIPGVSGSEGEVTGWVAAWGKKRGLEVDLWQAHEADLAGHPESAARHIPLAGRPNLVVRLPGKGDGRKLIFNAHADVVAPGDPAAWKDGPWSGAERDGRMYGRGACDVKGGLVSAMWALAALAEQSLELEGDVLLEVIPGEEDCVGLGTLASLTRGWEADGCVVIEPTESSPRCASRGGLRFEIATLGRAVHGTVKWLGKDAIAGSRRVLRALELMEQQWSDIDRDEQFAASPIARPITVDTIRGGEWQGMVCDRCVVAGYLELLPGDDIDAWQERFEKQVHAGVEGADVEVRFTERYFGHRTPTSDPLCWSAEAASRLEGGWRGFNSGCEAGLRARIRGTPTLVWGPGSLAQAHAVDEYVEWAQVRRVAEGFARLAETYCNGKSGAKARILTTKETV